MYCASRETTKPSIANDGANPRGRRRFAVSRPAFLNSSIHVSPCPIDAYAQIIAYNPNLFNRIRV